MVSELCPVYAPVLGALGAAFCISLACMGAAYGTAKSGVGICTMGVMRPELVMRSILPIVMSGMLGMYGFITSIFIVRDFKQATYSLYAGSMDLAGGLSCGLSSLAAGFAIGIIGDAGVRGVAQQPRLFTGMMVMLVFAEVLGLYGTIIGIMIHGNGGAAGVTC